MDHNEHSSNEILEKIYEGTFSLDGVPLTVEEQEKEALRLMKENGTSVEDETDLQIVLDNNEGSREVKFTIFKVHKQKKKVDSLFDQVSLSDSDKKELRSLLTELESLKSRLIRTTNLDEIEKLIQTVSEKVKKTEEKVVSVIGMDDPTREEMLNLQQEIEFIKKKRKEEAEEYNNLSKKMEELLEHEKSVFSQEKLFTEEQTRALQIEFLKGKDEINQRSISLKKRIDDDRKILTQLTKKRNKLEKALETSGQLGISVADVNEIQKALRSKKFINVVLKRRGLEEFDATKKKDDLSEKEKKIIDDVKKQAFEDIADMKRASLGQSVQDIINILYYPGKPSFKNQGSTERKLTGEQVTNITKNISKLPETVKNDSETRDMNPSGPAPADMLASEKTGSTSIPVAETTSVARETSVVSEEAATPEASVTPVVSKEAVTPISSVTSSVSKETTPPIPSVTPVVSKIPVTADTKKVVIYRDEEGKAYASREDIKNILRINSKEKSIKIKGVDYSFISEDLLQLFEKMAVDRTIDYKTVKRRKDEKPKKESAVPHVEAILFKLTDGLTIKAKDSKRFTASNLRPSKDFVRELRSGNWVYNIVHFVPTVGKVGFEFLRKLSAKLMTTRRAKESMIELTNRVKHLTEEELAVLFYEYRGSQLKTDMNFSINRPILDRLREYGLEKVNELNENIERAYVKIFKCLGKIKELDVKIDSDVTSKSDREKFASERQKNYEEASGYVKIILSSRRKANNLLSGGVHGLEEDFKAVASKMSYVGMRFAKSKNFDNALQERLAAYGKGLNDALADGDDEKIVAEFMGLESCYFKNSEVSRSIVGMRSTGKKYYTPLAQQFDYRDDPFIRDVFATIAVAGAVYPSIRSLVQGITNQNAINAEIQRINSHNDSVMSSIYQAGENIDAKKEAFQAGMEAQMYKDVSSISTSLDREALDAHNWILEDAMHASAVNQGVSNNIHDLVVTRLDEVSTRYATGITNQTQALQELSTIASGTHKTLVNVTEECLSFLKPYAQAHPEIDLTAVQASMEYIVSHPDAIANMNQAMVDVTDIASSLSELSIEHFGALSQVPNEVIAPLVSAASSAGLALYVSQKMQSKYSNKFAFDSSRVSTLMNDYLEVEEKVGEPLGRRH